MNEPIFTQLRTKESLGYIVGSSLSTRLSTLWLKLAVQSHVATVARVESRLEGFLLAFEERLVALTDVALQEKRDALTLRLCEPDKTFAEEVWIFAHAHT